MRTLSTNTACAVALSLALVCGAQAATLAPLPTPSRSFDAGSLHVDVYGTGAQSIIFIPGLASGPWSWSEQIAHFSPSYSVYALTLPGFDGRPDAPQSDTFEAFSSDFWSMLAAQKIERPAVIGHSLGGTLAIALAEQHPDRLRAAIALDGLPVFPSAAQSSSAQRAAMAKAASAQIAAQTPDQVKAYELNYMQTIGTIDANLAPELAGMCARSDPRAIGAWIAADLTADLRPALKGAALPLLELMPYAAPSDYTQQQTLAFYQMLLAGAPNAKVVAIPGARHFAMIDQPAAVDVAITQFLQSAP